MKRKFNLIIKSKIKMLLFKKHWTIIKIPRQQKYSIITAKLLDIV